MTAKPMIDCDDGRNCPRRCVRALADRMALQPIARPVRTTTQGNGATAVAFSARGWF